MKSKFLSASKSEAEQIDRKLHGLCRGHEEGRRDPRRRAAAAGVDATTVRVDRRQDHRPQRPLCRHQGAARRLLHDRRARSRRGAGLGRALSPARATARWKSVRCGRCSAKPRARIDQHCPGRRRDGGPAELRQARRVSRRPHRRCRRCRRRAVGGVASALAGLVGRTACRAAPRRGLLDRRAAEADRCRPAAAQRRRRKRSPAASGRRDGGRGERDRHSGPASRADVRLRASGD